MRRLFILLIVSLSIAVSASAQQITVRGVVTDSNGEKIIGANVISTASNDGVSTNVDGEYEFSATMGETLICSYIGFVPSEAVVSSATLNFSLVPDAQTIDDVVVVGYGSVKKGDLTGSVSSLKMDDMATLPASNSVMTALQGRVAGLQIITSSQGPASTSTVVVRGVSSLNGTQQPLIVLNGFPLGEGVDLKQINAEEIEDIVVLKDASSTSIYGSRGANGVIMVTTKKSTAGQQQVTFSHQTSISSLTSAYDIWSSDNAVLMAQLNNESRRNGGQTELYTGTYDSGIYYPSIQEILDGYSTTNWVDQVTQTPITTNTSIGLLGATDRTNYNFNVNYFDERGIYQGDNYDKLSFGLDVDHKLFDNFAIRTSTVVSTNNRENVSGGIDRNILYPVYNDDGTYFKANTSDYSNPVALRDLQTDTSKGFDLISSVLFDWSIYKDLSWKNQLNYKYGSSTSDAFYPSEYTLIGELNDGAAYIGNWQGQSLIYETYADYHKTIEKHTFSAVAGFSYDNYVERSSSLWAYGFTNETLGNENMAAGDASSNIISNGYTETLLLSYYGKLNYSFDDRYLVTGTFRTDGSSKFGANNRWAAFPSAAVAWKMHNESFMQGKELINESKIRVSYGISGNQGISPYQTLSQYGMDNYYVDGAWQTAIGPGYVSGYYGADDRFKYWSGIPNSDLKWETTSQFNIGYDLGMIDNRLRATVDYYDKYTCDLLRERYLPLSSGYDKMWVNDGEVSNRGVEVSLSYDFVRTKDTYFSATAIFSKNKNEIVSLGDANQSGLNTDINTGMQYEFTGTAFNDYSVSGMPNILAVGYAMNTFYGYKVDGIIQSEAEGLAAGLTGDLAQAGEFKYVDISGDGVINDDDRTVIGDPNPDFTASLNLSFSYKNFDASIFLYGSYGGDVLNPYKFSTASAQAQRWTADNPTDAYPSLRSTRVPYISDWFIEDGSYLRIQDINIGYTFNKPFASISKIRVYGSVNNLFTFTSFSGYDPEVGIDGIYYGGYPRFRKFVFGLNVTL